MAGFEAIRIDKDEAGYRAAIATFDERDLMDGNVDVDVSHSTINFKDGLSITGKSPIVRRFPMIGGIDFAGTVTRSNDPSWKPGDQVILNGWGVGESHFGGYSQKARVNGGWLVPLPAFMTAAQAMAVGTAGYTAMLCVMALERAGLSPASGPVVVTGAAGGVGSIAIMLLSRLGWKVVASTGRREEETYLRDLGATDVIDRNELSAAGKMLGKERWAAGVDSVGSHTLANVLAQMTYGGAVAACGLAQGLDLPTSVTPFILRSVSLLGIDSVMCPIAKRREAWKRLANDLESEKLSKATKTIGLARSPVSCATYSFWKNPGADRRRDLK